MSQQFSFQCSKNQKIHYNIIFDFVVKPNFDNTNSCLKISIFIVVVDIGRLSISIIVQPLYK